jgi:hypothetical protein
MKPLIRAYRGIWIATGFLVFVSAWVGDNERWYSRGVET